MRLRARDEEAAVLLAGACASSVSRGSDGRGSSARSAPVTSTTCVVGGTPSSSISTSVDVIEDRGQLAAIRATSSSLSSQARQARDVQDLLAVDHPSLSLGRIPWRRHGPRGAADGERPLGLRARQRRVGPLVGEGDPGADDDRDAAASPANAGHSTATSPSDAPTPSPGSAHQAEDHDEHREQPERHRDDGERERSVPASPPSAS